MISINFDVRDVTGRKFRQPHKYNSDYDASDNGARFEDFVLESIIDNKMTR